MGARLMTGFLTLFLAFLLRERRSARWTATVLLGIVIAAAGVGNGLGTVAGNVARNAPPERIGLTVLCRRCGAGRHHCRALLDRHRDRTRASSPGLCAQLAKLSYDALVQRDVPEVVRTSVFARSETVFQICWVFGGALGISLPLIPTLGFGLVAAMLCGLLAWTLIANWKNTHPPRATSP